jgi:hypothetical protein
VKYFAWDDEKSNPDRYLGQRIFVVQREDYVYLVPFVEDEHMMFLQTIIPNLPEDDHSEPEGDEPVPR